MGLNCPIFRNKNRGLNGKIVGFSIRSKDVGKIRVETEFRVLVGSQTEFGNQVCLLYSHFLSGYWIYLFRFIGSIVKGIRSVS